MLNGAVMAASSGQDNAAQTTVVAKSDATVNVTQESSAEVSGSGTAATATEAKPTQTPTSPEQVPSKTAADPAVAPAATSPTSVATVTDPTAVATVTPKDAATDVAASVVVAAAQLASVTAPSVQSPVSEPRTQLTPTSSGWVMVPSRSDVPPVAQPEITHAIAVAAAALPPVNTPVVPKGLFGQWSQELTGVTLPTVVSVLVIAYSGLQVMLTVIVLAVLLVKLAGMTYGAWLRRVGHVNAARSDLTSLFFATPLLMDFIRVSPPERGPFLGVADINRHVINYSQKGAKL